VLHASLGSLGEVIGELIALEVDARDLADRPLEQILVGELAAQELVDVASVVGLQVVIIQFLLCDGEAYPGGCQLLIDLFQFDRREICLVVPLVLSPPVFSESIGD
jgi:hypothetical protein